MNIQVSTDSSSTATVLAMMRGYWISQGIFVAAKLGVADLLHDGPQSCATLSDHLKVPEQTLYRLLRALASVGIFIEVSNKTFGLTQLADTLRSDVPGSLRSTGIVMGEVLYPSWGELAYSIESGRPGVRRALGTDFFTYLQDHPQLGTRFQEMMAGLNLLTNQAVPDAYDFSDVSRLVDVGGGNGSLLASVLRANPDMSGVLFDLPHVLEVARANLMKEGVLDRCEFVGGDFFSEIPAGGDAYMLRWVLHDYDAERAIEILKRCRAAIPPSGRLLVVEQVMTDNEEPGAWISPFLDLQMLILFGGQERTEAEFRALLSQAGFEIRRIVPTTSAHSILEAVPADLPTTQSPNTRPRRGNILP